jgi:hypothetical protein
MDMLRPLRAKGFRSTVADAFGVPVRDGEPLPLNYLQVLANPKLAALGRQVYDEMRQQFTPDAAGPRPTQGVDDVAYRLRLESWADALEIMLEEVLAELESLRAVRIDEEDALI